MWWLTMADGRVLPLWELPATVGRDQRADVVLTHPSLRGVHARFSAAQGGGLLVQSLEGAAMSMRGERVSAARLQPGDRLSLGGLSLTVGSDTPESELRWERRILLSSREPVRRGLLHTELSQLTLGVRCLLLIGLLALAAGLGWLVSLLVVRLS